jgi:aminopeptidase
MDKRIKQHAEILVNHSASIGTGDFVVVSGSKESEELIEAIYEELGKIGAIPHLIMRNSEAKSRYYENISEKDLIESEHSRALWQKTDASIGIRGSSNIKSTSNIDPDLRAKSSKVNQNVKEERLNTKWVLTQHPTGSNAQKAGMSTREYRDFVYNAVDKDWEEQREFQSNLVDILDDGKSVRIVSGDKTDITMNIDGMKPVNDYGEHNMPGGEVFTAPVINSVEGSVLFDKPLMAQGREVQDVYLEFVDGFVTEIKASQNEEVIKSIIETDEGSCRLGELGVGMNRDIDQFTYNMLFDEKMGDTVHMALGRAYEDNAGEDREQNQSAVHTDIIVDMSEDSYIKVDGEIVQENGQFIFE